MNIGWIWTLLLSVNVLSSLIQLGAAVWTPDTSDAELLLAFGEKQNRWSIRLMGVKSMLYALTFLPVQLQLGRALDGYLLTASFLLSGLGMLLYVPPSIGIHKSALIVKSGGVKWDHIHQYRWTETGLLEVNPNPGFFSLNIRRKLEIPAEFVADVQAMLGSQCPDRQIAGP